MGRWAPATLASRKWDGRVAWCARGVTAGALAGAAKGGLAQLSRRLERDDRIRTGRRSPYAPGADGMFLVNGFRDAARRRGTSPGRVWRVGSSSAQWPVRRAIGFRRGTV